MNSCSLAFAIIKLIQNKLVVNEVTLVTFTGEKCRLHFFTDAGENWTYVCCMSTHSMKLNETTALGHALEVLVLSTDCKENVT